jgi:hypothetical protein
MNLGNSRHVGRQIAAVAAIVMATSAPAAASGVREPGIVVHTALGGAILGYDVDQSGKDGILSEYLTLENGNSDVAVETFDQKTGKIVKIVKEEKNTVNDFDTLPVVGSGIGLVLYQRKMRSGLFKNIYEVLDPLRKNRIDGKWNLRLHGDEELSSVSEDQGQSTTAVMTFENGGNGESSVFATDVAADTFGPKVALGDSIFAFDDVPVMAYDSATNNAVIAASIGCRTCGTELALADLEAGTVTEFSGLGLGFVNGIAIDSADGIACTTTEIDFGVEFYDLATGTGIEVQMPNATSQEQSGADVEYDAVNKLFLIGQPVSSTGSGSSVQVFDTNGNFVESINNLSLPVNPVLIALNPNTRTAFVVQAPSGTELQSFTY